MQLALTALLIGVLVASMVSFVTMGLRQHGRTTRLARKAHESNMRFSASDPFDIPRRYAQLALLTEGHSARACNLTFGRKGNCRIRQFDYRYECGHGTRRQSRRRSLVLAEIPFQRGSVLMWSGADDEAAMVGRPPQGRIGRWNYNGSESLAGLIVPVAEALGPALSAIEVRGLIVAVCAEGLGPRGSYATTLDEVLPIVQALGEVGEEARGQAASGDLLNQDVENGSRA